MRKQSKIIFYAGIVLGFAAVLTGTALSGGRKIPKDFTVSYEGIKTADITAGVSVHDPSVIICLEQIMYLIIREAETL